MCPEHVGDDLLVHCPALPHLDLRVVGFTIVPSGKTFSDSVQEKVSVDCKAGGGGKITSILCKNVTQLPKLGECFCLYDLPEKLNTQA